MNKTTLKALKGSIEKWEKIVAGKQRDEGIANCPLCHEFYGYGCKGCPVAIKTKDTGCDGSPYSDKWNPATNWNSKYFADTPERKKAARAELRFLKSLLPKTRKK